MGGQNCRGYFLVAPLLMMKKIVNTQIQDSLPFINPTLFHFADFIKRLLADTPDLNEHRSYFSALICTILMLGGPSMR